MDRTRIRRVPAALSGIVLAVVTVGVAGTGTAHAQPATCWEIGSNRFTARMSDDGSECRAGTGPFGSAFAHVSGGGESSAYSEIAPATALSFADGAAVASSYGLLPATAIAWGDDAVAHARSAPGMSLPSPTFAWAGPGGYASAGTSDAYCVGPSFVWTITGFCTGR